MKKIAVRPANEIEIQFSDNVTMLATFNIRAMRYMMELLYEKEKVASDIPIEEFGAIIIYSGIKVNNPEFTIEEANAMALSMNPADLNEIIHNYNESTGIMDQETEEAVTKKVIAQILTGLAKSNSKK
ncbi:hypothetical protein DS742_11825 [Lacrimispora amygdalina]|uniref:Uncharacterized protein n=1 Tax=Lacrimispora amygdalina TaxID=253257 RepID=A0A3E2NCR9_9FIRM|nr:hypothetical protein [Clostridium indicum]RFZ78792.1 hypothetical protein DS742_11825 [Clostridium indicum]